MIIFNDKMQCSICVKTKDKGVLSAAKDLRRDLRRLADVKRGFDFSDRTYDSITVDVSNTRSVECYKVKVEKHSVKITGSDALGAIYGIYDFEKICLGIEPMTVFSCVFPQKKESIELDECVFEKKESSVRFRGWFVNDEDLLTGMRDDGGPRKHNYKFYSHVIGPEVIDMICETALRCGCNFLIPASLNDIMNEPEEKMLHHVYDRGLWISQHHIEPMGVSHFAATNYINEHGLDGEVSYSSNPDLMRTVWRAYAKKYKSMKDRTIFQVGLRGVGDQPVWKADKNIGTSVEERGALISNAVKDEVKILNEELGPDVITTMTLWDEGSKLYRCGALKLPKNVVCVFSDIGFDSMMADDFYTMKYRPGTSYGVYYHEAYYSQGPHNAEGVLPAKMIYNYRKIEEKCPLFYSVLNVCNIRPFLTGILLFSDIIDNFGNLKQFNEQLAIEKIFSLRYGTDLGKQITKFYNEYMSCIGYLDNDYLAAKCKTYEHDFHEYGKLPFGRFELCDGTLRTIGKGPYRCNKPNGLLKNEKIPKKVYKTMCRSAKCFRKLYIKLSDFYEKVPENTKENFLTYFMFQTRYMMNLNNWAMKMYEMQFVPAGKKRTLLGKEAVSYIEDIMDFRKNLETGVFKGWFNEDLKLSMASLIKEAKGWSEGKTEELPKKIYGFGF